MRDTSPLELLSARTIDIRNATASAATTRRASSASPRPFAATAPRTRSRTFTSRARIMFTAARASATMAGASVRPRPTPRAAAASAPLGRVAATPFARWSRARTATTHRASTWRMDERVRGRVRGHRRGRRVLRAVALRRAAVGVSATNAAGTPTAAAEATISEADATADAAGDPAAAPETTTTGSRCVPQHPSRASPPRAPRPPRVAPSPHRNPRAPRKKRTRRLSPRRRVSPRFHPHRTASLPLSDPGIPSLRRQRTRPRHRQGRRHHQPHPGRDGRAHRRRPRRASRGHLRASDAVRRAVSTVRIVMAEGDGPPGPWSDRGAAREVRRGEMGGDFVEETVPCTGLGPGRVIGKRGATVNRLQEETGARIEVVAEDGQLFRLGNLRTGHRGGGGGAPNHRGGRRVRSRGIRRERRLRGFRSLARARGGGGGTGAVEETVQFRSPRGGSNHRQRRRDGASHRGRDGVRIQVDKRLMECVVTGGPEEVRRAVRSSASRSWRRAFGGAVRVVNRTGFGGRGHRTRGPTRATPRRGDQSAHRHREGGRVRERVRHQRVAGRGRRRRRRVVRSSSRRNGGKTREDGPPDARWDDGGYDDRGGGYRRDGRGGVTARREKVLRRARGGPEGAGTTTRPTGERRFGRGGRGRGTDAGAGGGAGVPVDTPSTSEEASASQYCVMSMRGGGGDVATRYSGGYRA